MNIISEIVALFKVKSVGEDIIKEIQMPTASGKPGWKTSEFYFNLASQAAVLFAAIKGFIPANIAAIITVVGTAIYTIAATVRKAVADVQAAKASTTTSTTVAPVVAAVTTTTVPS